VAQEAAPAEAPAAPQEPVAQEAAPAEADARPTEPAPEDEAPPAAEAAQVEIDTETPRVGPKIVGIAEEKPPPIAVIKRLQDPRRPRRKRPNAAEKHRRAFFAKLNEFRGTRPAPSRPETPRAQEAEPAQETEAVEAQAPEAPVEEPQVEAPQAVEATEPEAAEAPAAEEPQPVEATEPEAAEAPDAEAPAADEPQAVGATEPQAADAAEAPAAQEPQAEAEADDVPLEEETPARRQARLQAAIERVGGPETVRQALQPKRDDDGQPKKWAVVCCDASIGLKPGDPTFTAWVRLAATPVREIKGLVRPDDAEGRGRRGGPGRGRTPRREGGQGGGGQRGGGGGRREGGGPRRERVSREDLAGAQDGTFSPTIRIIGLADQDEDRKERERRRKEEREAKRKAERERLERLGY
jgi:hypothetical protein